MPIPEAVPRWSRGALAGLLILLGCVFHQAAVAAPRIVFVKTSSAVFAHPHDLTLSPDGRFLYLADMNHNVVQVLDPFSLRVLGAIGGGDLNSPHDVAFDSSGRLLVADSGNDRIAIYQVNGPQAKYLTQWKGGFGSPEGVAASAGYTAVTNVRFGNVVRLVEGVIDEKVGETGNGPRQFIRPHDVEVGPDNLFYVADPGNNRIQVLTFDLDFVRQIGGDRYGFNEPKYLALDREGWLYVADQHNNVIKIFDFDRRLVAAIREGAGKPLNLPEGVAVRDNYIWVSDTYNNRVLLYRWEDRRTPTAYNR